MQLYRHYMIEGKTDRLSSDPYTLSHLANPDFIDGLKGWSLSEAVSGSIFGATANGYGCRDGTRPILASPAGSDRRCLS